MVCTRETVETTGLNVWSSEATDQPALIADIIAVQGLGADPYYTWVKKQPVGGSKKRSWAQISEDESRPGRHNNEEDSSGEVMWPRDVLVPLLKNARIATYSYKSDWTDRHIKTSLRECAEQFLNILKQHRQKAEEQRRPLVLIGHSLGGLVIQQALVIAIHQKEFTDLHLSIAGIIFLGTPFQGSDAASIGTWLAQFLGLDSAILKMLQKDSAGLYALSRDFWGSYSDYDMVCFYEKMKAGYGPLKMQIVSSQSSSLHKKRMIFLDTNHSGLNKFSGEDDENFKRVLPEIRRMVESAGSIVTERYRAKAPALGIKPPESTVPISRDKKFVGRLDVLAALDKRFSQADSHNRAVLAGLGGVGKSQIAIEYSYRLRERDPDSWVFWVYASTAERFEKAYRSIATKLDLPGADDPKTDVLGLVSRWLSNVDNGRWLMIVDNADDIDMFQRTQGEGSQKDNGSNFPLSSYIPQTITGSVLLTTRDRRAASWLSTGYQSVIAVNLMEPKEADQLLRINIPEGLSTKFNRAELIKELDNLPLAISQAAAYISAKAIRMTVSKYLMLYRQDEQSQSRLLDEEFGDLRRDSGVPHSVTRTWHISFEQIKRNKPQAAELLSLMAMLDRQGIPEFLLRVRYPNPLDLEDALAPLGEFSLITIEKGGKSFEMHRLVQLATRNWVEQYGDGKRWQGEAVEVVAKAFPDGSYSNWKTCEILSPHALKVLKYKLESSQSMLDVASLLHNMSSYNCQQGFYKKAETDSRESLATRQRILLDNDIRIYESVSMLATVLFSQGKYAGADAMNRQTLAILEEVLGKRHPSTLTTMSNLALVLDRQGKYAEAEAMNRQTLAIEEEVLGKRHPSTLTTMSNLALVLRRQGKYADAEAMNRQTLAISEEVLGKTHPGTLSIVSNLALVLRRQGKYADAEAMNRQTLAIREEVLGKIHPDTLTTMNNLALVLDSQGKYADAEAMNRQTLAILEEVLGKIHPETLTSVYNLAHLLQKQKGYEEASVLYERACTGFKSSLGSEHPTTKACVKHYLTMLDSIEKENKLQ